jgi:hypothetical protein
MSIRREIQKLTTEALRPQGFTANSSKSFSRQIDEQLHFVGLQYDRFSSQFTFNIGCHFLNIPSSFDYEEVNTEDIEELDCGLRCRVGDYIGNKFFDIWWDPARVNLPASIAQASWAIDRAFNDCLKKCGKDGSKILKSHILNSRGAIKPSQFLRRWTNAKGDFERFAFVALLAHRHGDEALSQALHEKALSCETSIIIPSVPKLAAALPTDMNVR